MFEELEAINSRPAPFQFYTADELWTDEHTSRQMLEFHLNESVDLSSRNRNFIDRSAEWISSLFEVGTNTSIADFGCGPGLYATRFAEKGATVTGIDFSERSILYAREAAGQRGLYIEYVLQDYLEYETEKKFDLITMIMCDFCALSPAQRSTMLGKFHNILDDDGSVLLDVYSLHAFDQREEISTYEYNLLNGFWSAESYYGFLNTFKYEKEKVVLDKYTIVEKARTRIVYNWLQYFSQASLRKEFEENGFDVEGLYSDVAGTTLNSESMEMAVVAKKA
jgi:SAM-dependent methyltransferase